MAVASSNPPNTTQGFSFTGCNLSYVTVAANQTGAPFTSAGGKKGDYINGILVVPASTSPGAITIIDNATSIDVFTGGVDSLSSLIPFFIPLGLTSVSGGWTVTTSTDVSVIVTGRFT